MIDKSPGLLRKVRASNRMPSSASMASLSTRSTFATKRSIDEVQVSAITGKIVRVEHETKDQEEAEKRQDEKKGKH